MRYGQVDTSHVFIPNQGFISTYDVLLAFIIPGIFWWTGISVILMIVSVLTTLSILRLMQPKGERKASNQFMYEWIVKNAQKKDSSALTKSLGNAMAKQGKNQLGCYQVIDNEKVRP